MYFIHIYYFLTDVQMSNVNSVVITQERKFCPLILVLLDIHDEVINTSVTYPWMLHSEDLYKLSTLLFIEATFDSPFIFTFFILSNIVLQSSTPEYLCFRCLSTTFISGVLHPSSTSISCKDYYYHTIWI